MATKSDLRYTEMVLSEVRPRLFPKWTAMQMSFGGPACCLAMPAEKTREKNAQTQDPQGRGQALL